MSRFHALVALAFLLSVVLATPLRDHHQQQQQQQPQKRSFKVTHVRNPNYKPNGPRAYRRALSKFGLDDIRLVPGGEVANRFAAAVEAASNSSSSTNSTTSTTTNSTTGSGDDGETAASGAENDALFVAPVTVGGQEIVLNFDTGSSDMWIFNTNLDTASQANHTIYDESKSTTAQTLNGTFDVTYGDGSFASGPVTLETVDIGGSTVTAQAVGLPNNVSDAFVTETSSNGLIGLAFSKLNTIQPVQQKTFFDNVMDSLTQPVFTALLKHDAVGAYEFGIIDTSAFSGNLSTADVDSSNGFWQFDAASAVVAGTTVNISGGTAIADTGTSLLLASDELVDAYWGQVDNAQLDEEVGGVIFPCDSDLPDLQVAVGNSLATINTTALNFSDIGTDDDGTSFCFGGLQSNQGLDFAIYGDVFFKSNFVVFDGSTPSLSFAPHS